MNLEEVNEVLEYRDGGLFWKVTDRRKIKGTRAGSINNKGYRKIKVLGKVVAEHRLVFFMHHGYFPEYVDHINGVRDDNRIENLRECTVSQNNCNSKRYSVNTSGHRNVYWHHNTKKWMVVLHRDNVRMYFGYYDDLELASLVAEEARDKFHGEFARHS